MGWIDPGVGSQCQHWAGQLSGGEQGVDERKHGLKVTSYIVLERRRHR